MTTLNPSSLSVDDMLIGEILMSLKRDIPTRMPLKLESETSYRSKATGLSVEVTLPSIFPSLANSFAGVFSFDAFGSVSPMSCAQLLPIATPSIPVDPSSAQTTAVTPRGSSKRHGPVIQLDDLKQCFNMPIAAVARKFGICATLLKKICRRHGIQRWPHRQIRSLQKSIDMLRESLRVAKGTNKDYIAKKIGAFEYTLECIMKDPNTAAKGISAGQLASPAMEEMIKRGIRMKNRQETNKSSVSISDDEAATTSASLAQSEKPITCDAPESSIQRLTTRRASVPMSLQSILC